MGFNLGFKGLIQTGTNHCVMRNAQEDMAVVTNRGTSQIWTTSNCRKINTICNYVHVNNINMTMIENFFCKTW
jgi:hypothetical protein